MVTDHQHCEEDLGFIFIHDKQLPRKYLLDTGANRNLIASNQLTKQERQQIDKKPIIRIKGFNKTSPITYSLGEVYVQIHATEHSPTILFDVMPSKMLNYNLIGVGAIQQYFFHFLLTQANEVQASHQDCQSFSSQAQHIHTTDRKTPIRQNVQIPKNKCDQTEQPIRIS